MRILVVDDEKLLVKGLKFNLENEGYQVDVCYDGRSAVDMARQGDYGLILLDLMMPELDGLGACMEIREFSDYEAISDWALEAMTWAVNAGVLNGRGGGVLDPAGHATRAEAAQILMNFRENAAK